MHKKQAFSHLFPLFSSLLHWQSTIPLSYDISQYAILFTKHYTHSTEKKYKNPTKINGSVMISLLVGDQQAQNFNRILGYSQNSQKHARYLASWHTYKHTHTHTHDLSNFNEFGTINQRLPTDFEAVHRCLW